MAPSLLNMSVIPCYIHWTYGLHPCIVLHNTFCQNKSMFVL